MPTCPVPEPLTEDPFHLSTLTLLRPTGLGDNGGVRGSVFIGSPRSANEGVSTQVTTALSQSRQMASAFVPLPSAQIPSPGNHSPSKLSTSMCTGTSL